MFTYITVNLEQIGITKNFLLFSLDQTRSTTFQHPTIVVQYLKINDSLEFAFDSKIIAS